MGCSDGSDLSAGAGVGFTASLLPPQSVDVGGMSSRVLPADRQADSLVVLRAIEVIWKKE